MDWLDITQPLPAYIHTFINLRDLPKYGIISADNQRYIPGMHAVVHSFSAVDINAIEVTNTMIGMYTVHRDKCSQLPTLYIIPVTSIVSPIIGSQDVGNSNGVNGQHLFLIWRMDEWPDSWDSIITAVHGKSKIRAPSPEKEYEKHRWALRRWQLCRTKLSLSIVREQNHHTRGSSEGNRTFSDLTRIPRVLSLVAVKIVGVTLKNT